MPLEKNLSNYMVHIDTDSGNCLARGGGLIFHITLTIFHPITITSCLPQLFNIFYHIGVEAYFLGRGQCVVCLTRVGVCVHDFMHTVYIDR